MVQVKLAGVTKRFGETVAVKEISFTASPGEFLTLLGPSGCGKTTTLRLIAGFEQPDAGDILFDRRSVLSDPPERRRVGMVFQSYALFPHMSVKQNVLYGLRFRRGIDKRARVQELLEMVGLAGLERRSPTELSAGQRQRVALARALAPQPRILLLDEPLSALDAKLRESLRTQIHRIQQELTLSTIYVTHDQEEALAISDRTVIMNEGVIEQIGTPQEAYERPQTAFVASFIGRTNRLEGKVAAVEQGIVRVRAGDVTFVVSACRTPVTVGDRVALFIKEEHLQLDERGDNVLPARVISLEYHGEATVVHLESPLGSLRIRASYTEISVLDVGEQIKVSFPTDKAILFPDSFGKNRPGTWPNRIGAT